MIKEVDKLMDSDFSTFLKDFTISEEKILNILNKNQTIFIEKTNSLGKTAEEINSSLRDLIKENEKQISSVISPDCLSNKELLRNETQQIADFLNQEEPEGLFLTEDGCNYLLEKHPPVNLLSLPSNILDSLDSFEKLSLTRHTEDKEWQLVYLPTLKEVPNTFFSKRSPRFQIIDTASISSLLSISDMKQKPWRISHTKETGCINVFTHDKEKSGEAPIFQFAIVLFHYYYETIFTGQLLQKANENDAPIGGIVVDIICTGKNKFSFFHPNSYSEHLYWAKAVGSFQKYFIESVDISFFLNTITCGGLSPKDNDFELVSLNIIDHIWNANIPIDSTDRDYFQFSNKLFLYHFREGLWYEILNALTDLSPTDFESYLKNHLDLGDQELTTKLLCNQM